MNLQEKNSVEQTEIDLVAKLLKHILTKNYFEFYEKLYVPISGSAMGTNCTLNYSTISM